jgi:hypothetical protein
MLYLPGLQNVVADFLSRPSLPPKLTGDVATTAVTMSIDFAQMAAKQNLCPEIQHLLGGSSLTIPFQQAGIQHLVGNVSTDVFHPVVPARAGHNFHCPLISPLSVDPLVNGTALILHFENVNLTEDRLFLSLFKASTLKI